MPARPHRNSAEGSVLQDPRDSTGSSQAARDTSSTAGKGFSGLASHVAVNCPASGASASASAVRPSATACRTATGP